MYAEESDCYLCGGHVDQTLANYRSGRARSVHHLVPPDLAPELANDRGNLRLAHLGCNSKHGRGAFKGAPTKPTPRRWGYPKGPAHTGVGMGRAQGAGAGWTPERDW